MQLSNAFGYIEMMNVENTKAIWSEICFLLHEDISQNILENIFEQKILMVLEKLGWSRFRGEIELHPSLQVGRQGVIEPDIVIKDEQGHSLIVIEVKRPAETIEETKYILQLTSYMRQTKAQYGLLVGSEIRIYYDGPLNRSTNPLMLEDIPFKRDIKKGMELVTFLERGEFLSGKHIDYVEKRIEALDKQKHRKQLETDLLSEPTKQQIYDFLKNQFSSYGDVLVENVLSETDVQLSIKNSVFNSSKQLSPAASKPREPRRKTISESEVSGKTLSLSDLKSDILGKNDKPERLIIGNEEHSVRNWTELCIRFVEWLLEKNYLSNDKIPIFNHAGKNKYFISGEKRHADPTKDAQWISIGNFYVDTKYNAESHKKNIISTLDQLGISHAAKEIKIVFR